MNGVKLTEEWIDKTERPPTEADADEFGCVVVWHEHQGFMNYNWYHTITSNFVRYWAHVPDGPEKLGTCGYSAGERKDI